MISTNQKSSERLKIFLADYKHQLAKGIDAIKILDSSEANSEEFIEALANLQVCVTILEPYSEGMVEIINNFIENMYGDNK